MPRGSHRPEQADSGVEAATAHLIRGASQAISGHQWSSTAGLRQPPLTGPIALPTDAMVMPMAMPKKEFLARCRT